MSKIPNDHPRAASLRTRELLVRGLKKGIVVPEGLIAHGRGEAFDYLLGERTTDLAYAAMQSACASLLLATRPVLSVNGNAVALCAKEIVELSEITGAVVEVNLFYKSKDREVLIENELKEKGLNMVLGTRTDSAEIIPGLKSRRKQVDRNGIFKSDAVVIPLEDGDRAEALARMGKRLITIDLNPLSRTAKVCHISIIDNIIRALPAMVSISKEFKKKGNHGKMRTMLNGFNNQVNLNESLKIIRSGSRADCET
jgi:4-phosphopantoate---beta-alanine ligase